MVVLAVLVASYALAVPFLQDDLTRRSQRTQQQQAVTQLQGEVSEKCNYQRTAYLKSYQFRKKDLYNRIQSVDETNIRRMYESQLRSLETEKDARLKELDDIQERATVEETTLVKGIISVH